MRPRINAAPERRVLYIVPPPELDDSVSYAQDWTQPDGIKAQLPPPNLTDITEYLQAFYHAFEVKTLTNPTLTFTSWDTKPPKPLKQNQPLPLGLTTATSTYRITTRPTPSPSPLYPIQLNLNDLLDTAIAILPPDAYALLLLTHHDLYEDAQDDFCCGRAYGGSRVAVVSTARYKPLLDVQQEVEREHAWPASHCTDYVRWSCYEQDDLPAARSPIPSSSDTKQARKRKRASKPSAHNPPGTSTPMSAALTTYAALPTPKSKTALTHLWLSRVCKTAAHELGHCVGLDHCTYYACLMQGTAGLAEDARQPFYLCPVDSAKVDRALGGVEEEGEKGRCKALLEFCGRFQGDRGFGALGAWLGVRLRELELERGGG